MTSIVSPGDEVPNDVEDLAQALARERKLLRSMIDLVPAYIYAKDAGSRFIAINEHLAKRMNTTTSDALGKTDFAFYPRRLAEKFFADEQALIESGISLVGIEEPGFDPITGQHRSVVTSKVPLKGESGEIIGIIGIGLDVTEKKLAEQKLATNQRLESVGRLAAGIAHEINTPVQYLRDTATFLRDAYDELFLFLNTAQCGTPKDQSDIESLQKEMPSAFELLFDGLNRIAHFAKTMKDFAHADNQQRGDVDLNAAVRNTVAIANTELAPHAEVHLELQEIPTVSCHGAQINQVVLALLTNSLHAIEDRGLGEKGVITVRSSVATEHVVLAISDTGTGIPTVIRDKIFEPFFTTKSFGRGAGQGLTLAHSIIKDHGGSIDFESEVGVGTTFFIRLPVRARS